MPTLPVIEFSGALRTVSSSVEKVKYHLSPAVSAVALSFGVHAVIDRARNAASLIFFIFATADDSVKYR